MRNFSDKVLIDPWSYLDYKPNMARNTSANPSWIGSHWRRLQAYLVLDMYYRNRGEHWIDPEGPDVARREYGDCFIITEQILASLMGESFSVVVPSATTEDTPELAYEQLLTDWNRKEGVKLKFRECERNAVKLGDGVYVLGWSTKKKRPVLRVFDPGFFFPVWGDDETEEEFPSKVHIAYEYEKETGTNKRTRYVRRITYELLPVGTTPEVNSASVPWAELNAEVSCFMSDGVWELSEEVQRVDDFNPARATWRVENLDLGIDFIPVVHMPNGNAGSEFWGVSSLSSIMQIFDDIIGVDTDLISASDITSTPIIAVQGSGTLPRDAAGNVIGYKGGTVYETEGPLSALDMSKGLDASIKFLDNLLERVSINGRIPESLLGRIKPSDVPSGISLWLSFSPHSSMINEMRAVREMKYPLLYGMVGEFYRINGGLPAGLAEAPEVEMRFGSYLPADRKETLDMVVNASNAKNPFMSLELKVRLLEEAGFPIEDALAEIARIQEEDVEGAERLVNATGDLNLGRQRLGLSTDPDLLDENLEF